MTVWAYTICYTSNSVYTGSAVCQDGLDAEPWHLDLLDTCVMCF